MANKDLNTLQFPGLPDTYLPVDAKARQALTSFVSNPEDDGVKKYIDEGIEALPIKESEKYQDTAYIVDNEKRIIAQFDTTGLRTTSVYILNENNDEVKLENGVKVDFNSEDPVGEASGINATTLNGYNLEDLKASIFNSIYPVGSVYISVNNTNPDTLFGGTWERIQDRFLLAASSSYAAGTTGGEAAHKLIASEMPKVTGRLQFRLSNGNNIVATYPDLSKDGCFTYTNAGGASWNGQSAAEGSATRATDLITFDNGGQNQTHNNMPPYLAVYVWKRIA